MSLAQRGRSLSVLGFLAAGGIGVLSATQTWLVVERHDAAEPILVTGAQALVLLTPLSLAVLALAAVLAIVGPVLRYVFAALGAVIAVLLGWSTLNILITRPLSAVASTVTELTGLAGDTAIADLVDAVQPTAWPTIALVGWIVLLVGSVFVMITARGWKAGGRRFRTATDATAATGPVDAIDSWDELSRGTDPTR
ncbi:Trp biosynthesis-associated membrane protein [Microbacterium sp. M28]|uniref:Trp biosynthesis-associated membrane protein n=1 Tax=Microbacterium sp. M28 TaxID=2962064 RepID=UPI0021F4AC01|nr:Trp biosynthesis-associated membrane protein [Microbacterium sp. M28]UYO98656.1 Trp biosynthesis-associated membrane protein [Microbacterium sp. M28]